MEFVRNRYLLKKALDETKDQSYVLYAMTQDQLAHTLFPLGGLMKTEVRALADKNDFVNADKPDSQDICFVPNGGYASFLERYTGKIYPQGNFIDINGTILGKHKGIIHYTIGQRKGLGLSFAEPMYVGNIDAEGNTVTLCREKELYKSTVTVTDFNWISGEALQEEFYCAVKIRYRQAEQPATVTPVGKTQVQIVFDKPQRAITPGQAAVLYNGDTILGGGIIQFTT